MQENTAILTAINFLWSNDSGFKWISETGMHINEAVSELYPPELRIPVQIGASPDGIVVYLNGTIEALEVKNHSPFSLTRPSSNPRYTVRDNKPNPKLAPWYVPQAMMHIYNLGPTCGSCLFVRQTATKGASIVRVKRNDEWIRTSFKYITRFKREYADEGKYPEKVRVGRENND